MFLCNRGKQLTGPLLWRSSVHLSHSHC